MIVKGTFEVTVNPEPPYDAVEGVALARASVDKRFTGPLAATSQVQMLHVRTPIQGSARYVAMERVTGTVAGKHGSFVLQHVGAMNNGTMSLSVTVVPDSGTGELKGISGRMDIQIVEGKHFYELDFELGA